MADPCDGRGFTSCDRPPTESDGRCLFHSEEPNKLHQPLLDALEEMKGTKEFDCRGWVFPLTVDLSNQEFQGNAGFYGARFGGAAGFWGAHFGGDAGFWGAHFGGNAGFYGARFGGAAGFYGASFTKGPSFLGARFRRAASFADTSFDAATTLDSVAFGPGSRFARTDLRLLTFRRCYLGGVVLNEAYNLALAEFDDCRWGTWRERGGVWGRLLGLRKALRRLPLLGRWLRWASRRLPLAQVVREVVYEEGQARRQNTRPAYERAQRVYRLLRRSLEDYKHFQEANRFAYRELEMRRLGYLAGRKRWWERLWGQARANLLSFEALYHQLSSYGESWLKPLVWLLVSVFVLFPALYTGANIQVGDFTYAIGGPWNPGPLLDFSLRTAALLPTPDGAHVAGAALLLQVIERVWSPFLAVLFTLAVRRRFRR